MNSLYGSLIILAGIGMYACPILLLIVWILRFRAKQTGSYRLRLGWISLALASAAFIAFYGGMFFSPDAIFDSWFRTWFIVCSCFSGAAFLTGIVGKGRLQWVVLLSAVTTPLACLLQKVLE
jgi:hypothetical protein